MMCGSSPILRPISCHHRSLPDLLLFDPTWQYSYGPVVHGDFLCFIDSTIVQSVVYFFSNNLVAETIAGNVNDSEVLWRNWKVSVRPLKTLQTAATVTHGTDDFTYFFKPSVDQQHPSNDCYHTPPPTTDERFCDDQPSAFHSGRDMDGSLS